MIKKWEQSQCLLIKKQTDKNVTFAYKSIVFSNVKGTGTMDKPWKIYLKFLWFYAMQLYDSIYMKYPSIITYKIEGKVGRDFRGLLTIYLLGMCNRLVFFSS